MAAIINNLGKSRNIDELAKEVFMDKSSLRRLLIDLRTDERLKFRLDSNTGEIVLGESWNSINSNKIEHNNDEKFCPYCGKPTPKNATFCPNCGTTLY